MLEIYNEAMVVKTFVHECYSTVGLHFIAHCTDVNSIFLMRHFGIPPLVLRI